VPGVEHDRGAVFVLPLARPGQSGPVAAWATTGGWAQGAERVLGRAWVVSDSGVTTPREASQAVTPAGATVTTNSERRRRISSPPATLARDVRRAVVGRRRSSRVPTGPWLGHEVVFVWQRHALFRDCGFGLANHLDAPLVLSVHGLQVEEAAGWGVKRPGWGRLAERLGEVPQLRAADLVACVSDGVAAAVTRRGVPDGRVLVTPNGVDAQHFQRRPDRDELRQELGIQGRFVVGWSGSFRSFHGLDLALDAMEHLRLEAPEVTLLLMGDGPHRRTVEQDVARRGLRSVLFVGSVSYDRMPSYLSACDAGFVLSEPTATFHYSPVKLREYMACELPVIAHRRGEMEASLTDHHDALLVEPGEVGALVAAIQRLRCDAHLRGHVGRQGRAYVMKHWSWTRQVERVVDALDPIAR
jgi:glycosyltransferase involved in cell wall biosynthesis